MSTADEARDEATIAQAANTAIPAILALRSLGLTVERSGEHFVARGHGASYLAEDPVAVLGLVKLVEVRRPWHAADSEIESVLAEFWPDAEAAR